MKLGASRVAVYIEPTRLIINGSAENLADGKSILLPTGVQVSRLGNLYVISAENGDNVRATLNSTWIDAVVGIGHSPESHARGLLGNPKGNARQLFTAAGAALQAPLSFADLYHPYADGWRVPQNGSLFSVESHILAGIPAKPFFARDLNPEAATRARAVCKAAGVTTQHFLDACMLDSAVLNDETAARVFVKATAPRRVIKPVLRAVVLNH